eukprot:gene17335-22880_t
MSLDSVIIGLSGGIAENVAIRLIDLGYSSKITTILDKSPVSPELNDEKYNRLVNVYVGDVSQELIPLTQGSRLRDEAIKSYLSNKLVIICGDDTIDTTITEYNKPTSSSNSLVLLDKLSRVLPSDISSLIVSNSVSSDSNSEGIFNNIFSSKGSTNYYRKWSQENNIPFSALRYGKLTGGVIGSEPLPFIGLPLIEPELHPSYVLRSVVLSDITINKYASTEICTRLSLAEAIARLATRQQSEKSLNGLDALVVSIAGDPPSDRDWNQLFTRIVPSSNAELLRIDFSSVPKPDAFINWIVDVWFPQALVDADAATVLTGARPVRATKSSNKKNSVEIRWDNILEDLSVVSAGGLEIELSLSSESTSNPYLSIYRKADKPLPSEAQLIDKLIEGVNKVAYKKGFCTPFDNSIKIN